MRERAQVLVMVIEWEDLKAFLSPSQAYEAKQAIRAQGWYARSLEWHGNSGMKYQNIRVIFEKGIMYKYVEKEAL
jgi:hypothetical protein